MRTEDLDWKDDRIKFEELKPIENVPRHIMNKLMEGTVQGGNALREVDGQWYWWDETWTELYGPYPTKAAANDALNFYAHHVLGI